MEPSPEVSTAESSMGCLGGRERGDALWMDRRQPGKGRGRLWILATPLTG